MQIFLRAIDRRIYDFKKEDPAGEVVLLFSGNLGGLGPWSEDEGGNLSYDLVREMAKSFRVAVTLGSPSGFDFQSVRLSDRYFPEGYPPNEFFYRQNLRMVTAVRRTSLNPNFKVLAANLNTTPDGQSILEPFVDFHLPNGKLRVVGLAKENYLKTSGYETVAGRKIFLKGQEIKYSEVLAQTFKQAEKDGVNYLIYDIPEASTFFSNLMTHFPYTSASGPHILALHGFGGTEKPTFYSERGTFFLGTPPDFGFSEAILDGKNTKLNASPQSWNGDWNRFLRRPRRRTFPLSRGFSSRLKNQVERSQSQNDRVVSDALVLKPLQTNPKNDIPVYLSERIAHALSVYGSSQGEAIRHNSHSEALAIKNEIENPGIALAAEGPTQVEASDLLVVEDNAVAFFSPQALKAYEAQAELFRNPVTVGTLKAAVGIQEEVYTVLLSGAMLEKFYSLLPFPLAIGGPFRWSDTQNRLLCEGAKLKDKTHYVVVLDKRLFKFLSQDDRPNEVWNSVSIAPIRGDLASIFQDHLVSCAQQLLQ